MIISQVNMLAVVVAAVVSMVLGFLWYSPYLFGKQWMKLSGLNSKELDKAKKGMSKLYGVSFVSTIILAFILSTVLSWSGASTLIEAVTVGFLVWVGFVATVQLTDVLFSKEKNTNLYLINTGYQLVGLVLMSAVINLLG